MSSRRITVVASELLGRPGTGGAATADSLLAVMLGRHGHDVRLLVASGRRIDRPGPTWSRVYESAGVEIRVLEGGLRVSPPYLAPTLEVFHALREDPPDVVVVDEWRGLGYAAMRARQLGVALGGTAFVVHCHSPARVLAEFAGKVPDTLARYGEEITERASIQLADAVVSPSAWLLEWMRAHTWPVPESARVIQYVTQSAALDEPPAQAERGPIRRLAFFGHLREGKGIRIFVEALNDLPAGLLDGVEVVFLGRVTPRWTEERLIGALSSKVKERIAGIRVETMLERDEAIEELRTRGTLAVIPSLLDNSPNTVYECIEHGIPFVATRTGGIPELVASSEHARVLCRPTAEDLSVALARALAASGDWAPVPPARDAGESVDAWLDVIETVTAPPAGQRTSATRVALLTTSAVSAARARRLAETTRSAEVAVVEAEDRGAAVEATDREWVVFLDDDDRPDDELVDRLVAAQAASDADAVTTAVRPVQDPDAVRLFLGEPGSLGLVENHYGVLGLVRRSLAVGAAPRNGYVDADWPLFARLALEGARITSVPDPLATHEGRPGRIGDVPGEGLAVLEVFEEHAATQDHDLPQLAATLAAAHGRLDSHEPVSQGPGSVVRRAGEVLQAEGIAGLARRARQRLRNA